MKVLLIDESPSVATRLVDALTREGHQVQPVNSVAEALGVELDNSYDVIVLCDEVPGVHDVLLCSALRGAERWTPTLVLSANAAADDVVRGLDAGADDYLSSPVSLGEITARMRALVRRTEYLESAVLEVGTLRMDPVAHRTWRLEHELALSGREFEVLEVFMRNPGRVLTRTRILESVWDVAYSGASNVVDQCIAHLRRKIDDPFGLHDLQTVRGSGYRLAG